ncbi:AraC family transcriptional regulator [Photobacterium alginatilyticum]|uniref:AraC family transcriptional regulator n=1 Tax=Photobacterium alginatilyticum TaxID=1775171 RepID=A0ABW9YIC5_9GAMM|nr:AraC family transcriptional regulator [Photobacterium alginatilyticum]NBI53513.1 AraC family transcriptional regulator [Photobacterium alginatilyticum]
MDRQKTNKRNFDQLVSVASAIELVNECKRFCSASDKKVCECKEIASYAIDSYIPESTIIDIWKRLDRFHPEHNIGLVLGKTINPRAKGVLTSWASQARNLGESLSIFINNIELMNSSEHWGIKVEGQLCYLTFTLDQTKMYPVKAIERSMCSLLCWARMLTANSFPLEQATFSFEKPSYVDEYEAIFGGSLTFGSRFNQLIFKVEFLDLIIESGNDLLKSIMEEKALVAMEKQRNQTPFQSRVRVILENGLDSAIEIPSVDQVAKEMHISRQTLFRRLLAEKTNYTKVLNEVRKQRASQLISSSKYSITETSYLLGFKDSSSFYKAFRRWYGISPKEYATKTL